MSHLPLHALIEVIRAYQAGLTMAKRVEFWQSILEGYCRHCGAPDPSCPCEEEV